MSKNAERLWENQANALRNPVDVFSSQFDDCGITADSIKYKADNSFVKLLDKLGLTLIVTREYENMVVALNTQRGKLNQTILPLPHPSGIAINKTTKAVYIASTRNPNQIVELRPLKKHVPRLEKKDKVTSHGTLVVSRKKYYPGFYYFHDLAFIGKELYGNSVGMNAIVKINMADPEPDKIEWFSKITQDKKGKPIIDANYIQLNSIAAGKTLKDSYFSASGTEMGKLRPGNVEYPVDKRGVIFSGKTRDVHATGLTRPHSARMYKGKVWVDNSGYGELGYIDKGKFVPAVKLPGWTRGLCFAGDVAFVGVSRVLPKFRNYAPGLKDKAETCGIYAVSMKDYSIIGAITWPFGNQIFGIEGAPKTDINGFLYKNVDDNTSQTSDILYNCT